MPQEAPQTFWMTRDEDDQGVVSEIVDVWLAPPQRQNLPGGAGCMWLGPGVTGLDHRYAQWPVDVARGNTNSHVIPDNSRECVKVG